MSYAERARSHSVLSMTELSEERHAASEETQDKTKPKKKKKRNVKSSKSTRTATASKDAAAEEVMGKSETRHHAKELRANQVCTANGFEIDR